MDILQGFAIAVEPTNLLYCFIGCFMGTLVGILPGLGPAGTIALLLPATYNLNPTSAIIMLSGICYGSMYGGSITSILVNIPGEPSSMMTAIDGYQMARKGRAGPALCVSAVGSFIAGTFSVLGLALIAPSLAKIALRFGPPEYFSLAVMSLAILAYLAKVSIIKSLMMAAFGMLLSTLGLDRLTATARFTFDIRSLYDGLPLPAILMGLFGVSEVLENVGAELRNEVFAGKIENLYGTRKDWKRSAMPMARGTVLGFFMGIVPGVGSIIPTLVSYVLEKRISKHPEKFGSGEIKGVAAVEACNNAAVGGTFIPLLSLGIPSSGMTAMLLAALMIYGLKPGPLLIVESPQFFWGVVASMYMGNGMLLLLNLPLVPLWVKLLKLPYSFLSSMILLFCLIGAYTLNNNPIDIIIMVLFGTFGFVLRKLHFEVAPMVLAFVLGPMMETALRRSLIISQGDFAIFLTRPIAAGFLLVSLFALFFATIGKGIGKEVELEHG